MVQSIEMSQKLCGLILYCSKIPPTNIQLFFFNVVYVNIFKFECDFKIFFDQLSLAHLSLLLKVKYTKTDALSLADRKIHFDRENPF